MDFVKRYYFLTLALFPLIQFVFIQYLHRSFVLVYGTLGTLLYLAYLFSGVKFKYPKYILPLILLVIYYFIWDMVNGELIALRSGIISYLFSNIWLHTVFFLILVANTDFDDAFIKTILLIFKGTIIIAFVVSIIQLFNPLFLIPLEYRIASLYLNQYEIRLPSMFGYLSPREVGTSFIPIISILIGYYIYRKSSLNIAWLFMAGLVFFANKSRWIYLNFVVILFQFPVVYGIHLKKIYRVILIGSVFLIVLIFVMQSTGFDFEVFIQERLLSESSSTRFLAFEMFREFFPQNPFFGTGIHVDENLARAIGGRSSQIHVGYLSHLYEYGIIGSMLLFSFWFMILKKFYLTASKKEYYGSLFAFIAFLVANLTLVDYSIYFYGLLFAFIFDKYIDDQPIENLT